MSAKIRWISICVASMLQVVVLQPVAHATPLTQWATSAKATTEFAGYPANNVAGVPDADGCRSPSGVWIPLHPVLVDSITLKYKTPVTPQKVNVYQNNFKNVVSTVQVSMDGIEWITIYEGDISLGIKGTCNSKKNYDDILSIPVTDFSGLVAYVKVTVDQSVINNFAQIDAVSLLGTPVPANLVHGKSLKFSSVAKIANATVPSGATIAVVSSSSVCKVSPLAKTVTAQRKGACTLRIVVTSKSGARTTSYLDVNVT